MFAVSAWMQMAVYVYISFLLFIKTLAMWTQQILLGMIAPQIDDIN